LANLFEDYPAQGILENLRIEQSADFSARPTLDQYGAQKAQGISLESRPAVWFVCRREKRFFLHRRRLDLLKREKGNVARGRFASNVTKSQ
jgi:hypothetical protein